MMFPTLLALPIEFEVRTVYWGSYCDMETKVLHQATVVATLMTNQIMSPYF